jgi:cytochrome c oxidase assembly protein subunit 15
MFKKTTIAKSAVLLALTVVLLGAYTRLKDAGLGCPDWPGCYGKLIVPSNAVDTHKAWIEMIHRYVASFLGIFILYLTFVIRNHGRAFTIGLFTLILVGFQGALGMWTVTLGLYPMVVMGHLIGGMAILSCLWWINVLLNPNNGRHLYSNRGNRAILNFFSLLSLLLLATQIILGGWTSATYSSLACADFPKCNGQWWPAMNWAQAFNFIDTGIFQSPGVHLNNAAHVTIQVAHRIGAILAGSVLFITGTLIIRRSTLNALRSLGFQLIFLLIIQITLGVCNVLFGLPTFVGVLHNAFASFLLMTLISILVNLNGQINRI